jgi:hypothetical protein
MENSSFNTSHKKCALKLQRMLSSFPWPDLFVSEIGKPRVIWKDSPTQQQFVLYPASPELGNPPLEMGSFE